MIIASQKRKENIAEYLLYMFQVEDLIRANSFDINLIDKLVISKFEQPYDVKREIREWYSSLIYLMESKNLTLKGHIPDIQSDIKDLESFHQNLLSNTAEQNYHQLYAKARSGIETLREMSNNGQESDIEVCLNGLYGLLMLRLMNKTISPETAEAFGFISEMMAVLSSRYRDFENSLRKN